MREVDPNLPAFDVATIKRRVATPSAYLLMVGFAVTALLLTLIGL